MCNRRVISAWLALFAMLMIFAGPLISQGIGLAYGENQAMSMAGMACDEMPGMGQMAHHASNNTTHHLVIWEKCGYCSLLFQHPPLVESKLLLTPAGTPPESFLSIHFVPEQTAPPVFPGARSRAPPV